MAQRPVCRFLNRLSFVVILALPLVPIAYQVIRYRHGMESIFPPGPLASAHAGFDCKQCHVQPWRGWQRALGSGCQTGTAMDQACASCHGGLLDGCALDLRVEGSHGSVVPPQGVAPHHARQIPAEVGNCADCHHEHQGDKGLLHVAEDQCRRCHRDLRTVDGEHTVYPRLTSFETDHPPFGWWRNPDKSIAPSPSPVPASTSDRGGGLQDTGMLHFNHETHLRLESKGVHGIDKALRRLKALDCRYCHQQDSHGRQMVPVRYERNCAECHPLTVRIAAPTNEPTVQEHVEAFCRQPAPHATPDVVSAVLRERLRLLAQQNPALWTAGPASEPPRLLAGGRSEEPGAGKLSQWVDSQTAIVSQLLFDSSGGCRYCHLEKRGSTAGLALVEYERTNIPSTWFPHAKFSHAKHGLMACGECHDQARTSTRTADVLMPTKQKCLECHSTQGGARGRARTDCLECHRYHPPGGEETPD